MSKVVHMEYSSSLSSLCEINSSFDTGILRIAYVGKNRNGRFISKSTFEKCMDTIYNCPIVCNYDRETDSIGGHDMELVTDKDGNMKIVNVTTPVGVIPESSKHFWSTVEEEDGTTHEYLCADVLIWKRQEAYKKIKEDGITSHSMELTVRDGSMQDGVYVINDFEFTAFCLLGDDHEPCFESSALSLFSYDELKSQMSQMMADLKESISDIAPNTGDNDTNNDFTMEGGEEVLDEKLALVAEYGFDIEKLEFSVEDIELDALRERLDAMKAEFEKDDDPVADPADIEQPVDDHNFELEGQLREEIYNALSAETVECSWGQMQRYCFIDYDREACEVYCYDTSDWKMYGFAYSMNGDNVVIDFACKKRKKFSIVDFDEGEQVSPIANVFENISNRYSENDAAWSEKYEAAENKITSLEGEVETLKQFKAGIEAERLSNARDEVFAKFEDLVGIEEFDLLRDNCAEYELAALEEKCFAIRGRNNVVAKFTAEPKQPKIMVVREEADDDGYGGLFTKYPPRV